MPNIASVTDLQRNYREVAALVKKSKEPVVILKKNKPEMVLANYDYFTDFEELKRKAEIADFEQAIAVAEREKKSGKLKKLKSLSDLING